MNTLSIGTLSQECGVPIETIRYYERSGLLNIPKRSPSGYRRYSTQDVKRLRFIRRGRDLGFSIQEIQTLLQLADHPEQPCHEADQLVQAHLQEVDAKLRDLQAIRDVLVQLSGCQSQTASHCHLLEALEHRNCCVHSAWLAKPELKPSPESD